MFSHSFTMLRNTISAANAASLGKNQLNPSLQLAYWKIFPFLVGLLSSTLAESESFVELVDQ